MSSREHREFAESAHPLNWYEVANLLYDNACKLQKIPQGRVSYYDGNAITSRRTSNRAVYLLAAFALENLIKAFLIYENPHYIEGGKLSNQILNGHGLAKLQGMCKKIPSPKRTQHIFRTLEVGVSSWARYPCATSVQRQSDELSVTPELWCEYCRVFNLYSERLERLLENNWNGPHGITGRVIFEKSN